MRNQPRRVGSTPRAANRLGVLLLVGLAFAGIQCSGGGGGGGAGSSFDVLNFSATNQSPAVFLNDSIEITFSAAVDPNTILSGVYIYPSASAGASRAQGQFKVEGTKVIFQPRLPTDPNFSDGGLKPNTHYTICVPRPGESCSVFIQNAPGVRSVGGRGLSITRTEGFNTVDLGSQQGPFRPEVAPTRPEVTGMTVVDSAGITQVLNPIINLATQQVWVAGILSTVAAAPPTTVIPGTATTVPNLRYSAALLTKIASSAFNPATDVLSRDPLVVRLPGLAQPLIPNEYMNTGGVLTITDGSDAPVSASWAIASNTVNTVTTFGGSGPDFDKVPFVRGPYTATVSQGLTRQVSPGDVSQGTEVHITFNEALNPLATVLDNFEMYNVDDSPGGLQYSVVAPASTLQGAGRQGVSHDVIDNKSTVTLRPKSSFPQAQPGKVAETTIVLMDTAQPVNNLNPNPKKTGVRDLNDFPLAYPKRTGWVLATDNLNNVSTVAHIQPLVYIDPSKQPPENVTFAWGFQTRTDATVANAIVETFVDQANLDRQYCRSSAAWTKAGAAGLFATYGYGGNGADGDLTVQGSIVLDSDTRQPGPDGIVEWSYNSLQVGATGTVTLKGTYPIRINSIEDMIIEGNIDASGQNGTNAPSGPATSVGRISGGAGGPGAGPGGDSNVKPNDPLGALPTELRGGPGYPRAQACTDLNKSENRLITSAEPNCGGGTGGNRGLPAGSALRSGCSGNGGGHAQPGVHTDYLCNNIQAKGREFGIQWVVPAGFGEIQLPSSGTGGGAGGNAAIVTTNPSPSQDIVAGSGGGGGGGLDLQCAGKLTVKGSAFIKATGGNGGVGFSTVVGTATVAGGYGAGGSGGCVWLSATSVLVESGATIDAGFGIGNPSAPNPARNGDGGNGYIIIRDRGASPDVQPGTTVSPTEENRKSYAPTNNGLSAAFSSCNDSGEASPNWQFDASDPNTGLTVPGKDLVWLNAPVQGQTVNIYFQASPDEGGAPASDPSKWYPAGNSTSNPCAMWETDINKIRAQGGLRHIRFRFDFDIGTRDEGKNPPNQVAVSRMTIRYATAQP